MSFITRYSYKLYFFITGWLILWVILFEFIFPASRFLPAPTVVIGSFPSLWKDYNLPVNLLSTVSVLYISFLFSFILVRYLRSVFLNREGFFYNFILSIEWFSKYIPGIIIGMMLIFWYPQSDYTEFIFSFFLAFGSMSITLTRLRSKINKGYTNAAISLGLPQKSVTLIEFNSLMPSFSGRLYDLHFYLWTMLLLFEFINAGYGMGFVLRQTLEFKDLSAFFSASIIIGIMIYLGSLGLKYIKKKFFSWSQG